MKEKKILVDGEKKEEGKEGGMSPFMTAGLLLGGMAVGAKVMYMYNQKD